MRYWPQKPPLGVPVNWDHPLTGGLVGCWLMNEGSGNEVCDLSWNGNRGSFIADTHFVAGNYGPVVYVDGTDDYIDCGERKTTDITNQITISVRIAQSAPTASKRIFAKSNSSFDPPYAQYLLGTNSDSKIYLAGDNAGTFRSFVLSPDVLPAGWNHVVATHDGTWSKIYINGILIASSDVYTGGFSSHPTWKVTIGRAYYDASNFFVGHIDDVLLYNRALSASEILGLYRNPFGMFRREPIEIWAALEAGAEDLNVYVYDTE